VKRTIAEYRIFAFLQKYSLFSRDKEERERYKTEHRTPPPPPPPQQSI
jgi:hypothetical protein